MFENYPIRNFIEKRLKELGFRRGELARRCGYANISKGVRRIDQVCGGDLGSPSAKIVLQALPAALEVDVDVVKAAVEATIKALEQEDAEREAAWRAAFKPSAYLLGTERRPSQIFIFGITGGPERWLRIPLDLTRPPITFAAQALAVVENTPVVPFFGATTGFIISYTPDHAVRFDLNGAAVEVLKRAYSPGQVELFIGRKRLPPGGLFGIETHATG
jgi:hypothetical protein